APSLARPTAGRGQRRSNKKKGGATRRPDTVRKSGGSVHRPAATIGIVLEEDFNFGAVELICRDDSELVVDLEEDDRGHEGAGEVPGVLLGEFEVVRHLRLHLWSGPFPLDGSVSVRLRARSPRRQRQAAAAC